MDEGEVIIDDSRDWRVRLKHSRDQGSGFAAPGGEFTRALYEWSFTVEGKILQCLMSNRRMVELGAGMSHFGYAMACVCGARNFVAVEPFYGDIQEASVQSFISSATGQLDRIPYKVVAKDMLDYLIGEPDDLLCVLACGIEDCILPGVDYRRKVEAEIARTMQKDSFFISSHSDLFPADLTAIEISFPRPSNPRISDRLRLHGGREALERYGKNIFPYLDYS
jgi:hypothetical protein